MALSRIKNEITELQKEDNEVYTVMPDSENLRYWQAKLLGPADSPYEGGTFNLDIHFPNNYPFDPPTVRFTTKVRMLTYIIVPGFTTSQRKMYTSSTEIKWLFTLTK